MKPTRKPSPAPAAHDPLAAAKLHFQAATAALRTGCAEALLTGLNLIAIHAESNAGHGGNRRSFQVCHVAHLKKGFDGALAEIGIPKRTAYRWMNACTTALFRCGILADDMSVTTELPAPGTPGWELWESELRKTAEGMSLNRLVLGCSAGNSDDQRQDELITRAEGGDAEAEGVLEKIANGEFTLVQAMRAAAGALATKGKERKDPVYLDFDAETKAPTGLIPKAFVTLRNGFSGWESYPPAARAALREEWHATRMAMPDELFAKK